MGLKEKIEATLKPTLPGARVLVLKQVKGRWLVYAASKAFEGQNHLDRQRVIDAALTGGQSLLSGDEYRTIALVRPFSPGEFRALLKERWRRAKKPKPAEPT